MTLSLTLSLKAYSLHVGWYKDREAVIRSEEIWREEVLSPKSFQPYLQIFSQGQTNTREAEMCMHSVTH